MSVTQTIVLPAQPAAGSTVQVALAGNGYTAPHSETRVRVNQAGDASGGINTIQVNWDPRWVSMVAFSSFVIGGLAAAQSVELNYRISANSGMGVVLVVPFPNITGINPQVTWCPPAQLCSVPSIGATQPNFRAALVNTDGDTYQLDLVLYNFKKDVLQVTPLSILLASLPRGTSAN